MALKISVGQYYHGDSLIHRLNPNVKCLAALLLMLATFFYPQRATACTAGSRRALPAGTRKNPRQTGACVNRPTCLAAHLSLTL